MGVGYVLKWENQALQRGLLDSSDYWFPSPVRQEDRSVGFRHGGHSLNPPSQLPHCITVGQTPADWLTDTPELFLVSLFLFILVFLISLELLPFWVILDFATVLLLECRTACVFKRSLSKQQRNIMGEMCEKKNSHRRGGREKRVRAGKKKKEKKDISTVESTT